MLNGRNWPDWAASPADRVAQAASQAPARAGITLRQIAADRFEASVRPAPLARNPQPLAWSAYWTVTEQGHSSNVKAGENAGEFLQHDFVVRQYTQAGDYTSRSGSTQTLKFRAIAPTTGHERHINLVVFEPKTGATLQALSLQCAV